LIRKLKFIKRILLIIITVGIDIQNNKKNVIGTSTTDINDGESGVSVITNLVRFKIWMCFPVLKQIRTYLYISFSFYIQLGKLTTPFITPTEIEEREEQLKNYFRARLNEHVARWQTSEAKATTFLSEVRWRGGSSLLMLFRF